MSESEPIDPEDFIFKVDDPVKVYRTSVRGVVSERQLRYDPRYGEPADAYLVTFGDGSTGWYFGRELERG